VRVNEFARATSEFHGSCECLAYTIFYAIIATGYLPDLRSLERCQGDPKDSFAGRQNIARDQAVTTLPLVLSES